MLAAAAAPPLFGVALIVERLAACLRGLVSPGESAAGFGLLRLTFSTSALSLAISFALLNLFSGVGSPCGLLAT